MATLLDNFIEQAEQQSWSLGEHDCMIVIADWIALYTGRDPIVSWRGRYWDRLSRRALVRREGGLLAIMQTIARGHLTETDSPARGDVAVARFRFGKGHPRVGAICLGDGWWWTPLESGGGLRTREATVIKSWRVGDGD